MRGRKARSLKRTLFGQPEPCVEIEPFEGQHIKILLNNSYQLLGTYVNVTDTLGHEIRHRRMTCVGVFKPLYRTVFNNEHVSDQTKLQLADSLAMSRLFFHGEAWQSLSAANARYLQRSQVQLYRQALKVSKLDECALNRHWTTDNDLLALCERLTDSDKLRVMRLKYLFRLYHFASGYVWICYTGKLRQQETSLCLA